MASVAVPAALVETLAVQIAARQLAPAVPTLTCCVHAEVVNPETVGVLKVWLASELLAFRTSSSPAAGVNDAVTSAVVLFAFCSTLTLLTSVSATGHPRFWS
jgi:hypothetical protein